MLSAASGGGGRVSVIRGSRLKGRKFWGSPAFLIYVNTVLADWYVFMFMERGQEILDACVLFARIISSYFQFSCPWPGLRCKLQMLTLPLPGIPHMHLVCSRSKYANVFSCGIMMSQFKCMNINHRAIMWVIERFMKAVRGNAQCVLSCVSLFSAVQSRSGATGWPD